MSPRSAWQLPAWVAAYALAVVAGRQLVLPETGLALFWPAAGVAALWFALLRTTRERAVAAAALVAVVLVVVAPEVTLVQASWWTAANLVQALLVASLLRRRPGLGPRGLTRLSQLAPASSREVGVLAAISVGTACLGAAIGTAGVLAAGAAWSWWIPLSWVIRNATGVFVLVALVGVLCARWRGLRAGGDAVLSSGRRVELAAAAAATSAVTLAVFGSEQHLPLAFLVIPGAVWLGLRFPPATALSGAVAQGLTMVGLTLAGRGPFGGDLDLAVGAATVQLFFLLCCGLALLLSISVTERRALLARAIRSEAQAQARAELVSAVTRVMHEGLLVVDGTGEVVLSNPAAHRMLGEQTASRLQLHQDSDADGSRGADGRVMTADERPALRALRGEVVDQLDLLRSDPETGAASVLSVSAVPLDRLTGDRVAVLVLSDVTEERARLAELKGFAGVMAHDLTGPLGGVSGWGEILDEQLEDLGEHHGVDVTSPRATLARIQTTARRAHDLIDDLLGYAMAGSGDLDLQRTTLSEIWRDAREQLPAHPHDGSVLSYSGEHDEIEVDVVLVRQLMVNLLGNAMKYVAPGVTPRVHVSTRVDGDRLRVEVIDNGIGIPRGEQARVFDGFVRSSRTGDYPGTGLGLAICARAVQRHGGTIGARDARSGSGTVIGFSLPRPSGAAAGPDPVEVPELVDVSLADLAARATAEAAAVTDAATPPGGAAARAVAFPDTVFLAAPHATWLTAERR